jgi:hypothetical protein
MNEFNHDSDDIIEACGLSEKSIAKVRYWLIKTVIEHDRTSTVIHEIEKTSNVNNKEFNRIIFYFAAMKINEEIDNITKKLALATSLLSETVLPSGDLLSKLTFLRDQLKNIKTIEGFDDDKKQDNELMLLLLEKLMEDYVKTNKVQ